MTPFERLTCSRLEWLGCALLAVIAITCIVGGA